MGSSLSRRGGALRQPTIHPVTGVRDDGTRWVRSFKILHPLRQQRVYIMPVPRFALKSFYNDWVFQPYVKDHNLCISTDIEGPPFQQNVAYRLHMKSRAEGEYKDYDIFYSPNMPDAVDANISRHELFSREFLIRTPLWRMFFTTNSFRDRAFHSGYVVKQLTKMLGNKHQYHPGVESGQSFVIFMPPLQVNTAINALEDLGFSVTEAIEHDVGDDKKIAKLENIGSWAHFILVVYIWWLIYLLADKYVDYVMSKAEENKAEYLEMKMKAQGKDY